MPRSREHPTCGSCRFRLKFPSGMTLCAYGEGLINRSVPACPHYLPLNQFKIRVIGV